jgi:hypothetical protein
MLLLIPTLIKGGQRIHTTNFQSFENLWPGIWFYSLTNSPCPFEKNAYSAIFGFGVLCQLGHVG